MIDFDNLQKLPKNVGDLGKLIVAKQIGLLIEGELLQKDEKINQKLFLTRTYPDSCYS